MSAARLSILVPFALASVLASDAQAQFVLADHFGLGMDDAEITPDGNYAVVRENTIDSTALVVDLSDGSIVASFTSAANFGIGGVAQDAVAVTNERAIVLGSTTQILDLTNMTRIAERATGTFPRDVEITPDGTLAVVRGGSGLTNGLFIFELATGTEVAAAPGQPSPHNSARHSFDVDSVAVTNDHAVCTSIVSTPLGPQTRVTVWDLTPAGGGAPVIVYETSSGSDQLGAPHDVAITPDGQHAAVRSELSVGLYRLDDAQSTQLWNERLFGNPGPFGNSAMDSIEVTNDRIATISRYQNGPTFGAQVDFFDIAGVQRFNIMDGDPHDLAITPDGTRLVVRTHLRVYLYDLVNLPPGQGALVPPIAVRQVLGTHTSFGAGLDSVAVTNDRAVIMNRNDLVTKVRLYDISNDELDQTSNHQLPDMPIDVAISPDESKVALSGLTYVMIIDLRTDERIFDHNPVSGGWWPWCDGVVLNDDSAVAFGYDWAQGGWLSIIDLFSDPASYCSTAPNSAGDGAQIFATGSARVSANDLTLWAVGLPAMQPGVFYFGDMQQQTAFGDGFQCVGGQLFRFDVIPQNPNDVQSEVVDYSNLPAGATVVPGSTFNFQYWYRDPAGPGGNFFNLSDAVSVTFEN